MSEPPAIVKRSLVVTSGDRVVLRSSGVADSLSWGVVVRTGRAQAEDAEYDAGLDDSVADDKHPLNARAKKTVKTRKSLLSANTCPHKGNDVGLADACEELSINDNDGGDGGDGDDAYAADSDDKEEDDDGDDDDVWEDDDDDDDDDDGNSVSSMTKAQADPPLALDQVRVSWISDPENPHEHNESDLVVVDRSFGHGDIVQRTNANGEGSGQLGLVLDVDVSIDGRLLGRPEDDHVRDRIFTNIDARTSLRHLHTIPNDLIITYNDWVGVAEIYTETIIVAIPASGRVGSVGYQPTTVLVMTSAEGDECRQLDIKLPDSVERHYFPGQRLLVPADVLRHLPRISGPSLRKGHAASVVVLGVYLTEIIARWKTCLSIEDVPMPPDVIPVEDLHLVKPCTANEFSDICLGDIVYVTSASLRSRLSRPNAPARQIPTGVKLERLNQELVSLLGPSWFGHFDMFSCADMAVFRDTHVGLAAVEVQRTRTRHRVLWQDGTMEDSVDGTSLVSFTFITGNSFVPGQYVRREVSDLDSALDESHTDAAASLRLGVVVTVDATSRTCRVNWISDELALRPRTLSAEAARTLTEKPADDANHDLETSDSVIIESEVLSVYEIREHTAYSLLIPGDGIALTPGTAAYNESLAGRVGGALIGINCCTGLAHIQWNEGDYAALPPAFIFSVTNGDGDSDQDDAEFDEDDGVDDQFHVAFDDSRSWGTSPWQKEEEAEKEHGEEQDEEDGGNKAPHEAQQEQEGVVVTDDNDEAGGETAPSASLSVTVDDGVPASIAFAPFDIVDSVPPDHVHASSLSHAGNRAFATAVRKDHRLLRSSLPRGVYVRAYEDRLDLLSACIVGPSGTPYCGCLFAFDVKLPADYPQRPPDVQYHSRSPNRLNPNLYETGKVCLSLLGTWNGLKDETWQPSESNLLQVFISIQGLILVSDPYFNEPGYEKQRGTDEGMERSRLYNEGCVVHSIETAASMALRPPSVFQQLACEYFEATEERTLAFIDALIKDSAPQSLAYSLLPVSEGFRLSLTRQRDRFVRSLEHSRRDA